VFTCHFHLSVHLSSFECDAVKNCGRTCLSVRVSPVAWAQLAGVHYLPAYKIKLDYILLPTTRRMLSPTGTRDPNVATRQRNYPQPFEEEEFILASDSNPTAVTSDTPMLSPESRSQRRSYRISQHLNLQENKEELVRYWDRFTRKGKNKIGVKDSLRALAFSSCAIYSLLILLEY